ncbi:transposase [Streptomyces sp. NPDC058818]|uniref:transposase n=1 Tax=Streptomyces sp. NPDC058818 TaxID=3346640 RepID=UPI0036BB561D
MLKLAKDSAVKARAQVINQLKAVLAIADPALRERMSRLGNAELFRTCARRTPRDGGGDEDGVAQATHMTPRMLAERIEQLTTQINELNQRLTRLVEHHAPQLLEPVGIGPDSAVTLLITISSTPLAVGARAGSTTAATGRRTRPCTASCSPGCVTLRAPRRITNAARRRARPRVRSSGASSDTPPARSSTWSDPFPAPPRYRGVCET